MRDASESWETKCGWEKIVCESVNDYPMAPRWAKEILEVAGQLFGQGVEKDVIIRTLLGQSPAWEQAMLRVVMLREESEKILARRGE